jgi:hypothetical protein
MSNTLNPNTSAWQIAVRVLLFCAVTVVAIVGIYFTIRGLAGRYS